MTHGGKTFQSDSNTSQNILVKATASVFFCVERTGKAGYRHEKKTERAFGGQERNNDDVTNTSSAGVITAA
jgi:hypothetical protein